MAGLLLTDNGAAVDAGSALSKSVLHTFLRTENAKVSRELITSSTPTELKVTLGLSYSVDVTHLRQLFGNTAMKTVLEYKWRNYARSLFMWYD